MSIAIASWPLSKILRYVIAAAVPEAIYLYAHLFTGRVEEPDLEWRKVVLRFSRTGQDDIVTTLDLLNITSSEVDLSWTTTDYTDAETLLDAFVTAWKPFMAPTTTLVEYRWYRMAFTPVDASPAFTPSVIPERLTAKSIAGTGSTALLPPQCRCVISELTGVPKHNGRMYMPFDGVVTSLATGGQIPSGSLTTLGNAAEALYEGLWAADLLPVVPVTQIAKDPARVLLNVTSLRLDSIIDIQRRGRPVGPAASTTRVLA